MTKDKDQGSIRKMAIAFFPNIVSWVVGTSIALAVFRTDIGHLSSRVDAMEDRCAAADVVNERINNINNNVDSLKTSFDKLSEKLDRHLEK